MNEYAVWRFWIDILQAVLTAAVGLYVWIVNRTRVNAARIRKLEDDIDSRLDDHGTASRRWRQPSSTAPAGRT